MQGVKRNYDKLVQDCELLSLLYGDSSAAAETGESSKKLQKLEKLKEQKRKLEKQLKLHRCNLSHRAKK